MELLYNALSVLVIICLLGAMLFATRAIKNRNDGDLKKKLLLRAGMFFAAYAVLNILRLYMESSLL